MIDLGPGPLPNDRERQLALDFDRDFDRADKSRAWLLTAIAKLLASYRVELSKGRRKIPTRQSRESADSSARGE